MLEFRFIPSNYPEEKTAHARIIVGESEYSDMENEPTWYIPIDFWNRKEYIENWLLSLNSLERDGVGAFILHATELGPDTYSECYSAWKKKDHYIFQKWYILPSEFDEEVNINCFWKHIGVKPDRELDEIIIYQEEIDKLRKSLHDHLSEM